MIESIKSLLFANSNMCYICKESSNNKGKYICKDCYEKMEIEIREYAFEIKYVDRVYYCGLLNKFNRDLVTKFKFHDKSYLSKPIGEVMTEAFKVEDIGQIDMIIPVPIHRIKKAKRGFNQSELLADYLSGNWDIPVYRDGLIKIKQTKAQSSLDLIDRIDNLKDSFMVNQEYKYMIEDKTIMIIDDILTTGTTLNSCGKLLKLAGAKKIIALTFVSAKN